VRMDRVTPSESIHSQHIRREKAKEPPGKLAERKVFSCSILVTLSVLKTEF